MNTTASAKIRYLRVAPRKARMVADCLRGKPVQFALDWLTFNQRHVAKDFKKLIQSAVANAEQKGGLDLDNLVLKTLVVDQGPIMKRWRARARGSGARIEKKTSHIEVVLGEK